MCSGSWQAGGAFLSCRVGSEQVLHPTAKPCQAGSSCRDSVSSVWPWLHDCPFVSPVGSSWGQGPSPGSGFACGSWSYLLIWAPVATNTHIYLPIYLYLYLFLPSVYLPIHYVLLNVSGGGSTPKWKNQMKMRNSLSSDLYRKWISRVCVCLQPCSGVPGDRQSCGDFQNLLETHEDQKLIFMSLLWLLYN